MKKMESINGTYLCIYDLGNDVAISIDKDEF